MVLEYSGKGKAYQLEVHLAIHFMWSRSGFIEGYAYINVQ